MIINVIDMVDGGGYEQKKYLKQIINNHFIELYLMSNGLKEMKNKIIQISSHFSIKVLRIWGHGAPGIQNVSLGKRDPTGLELNSTIMIKNLHNLIELRWYFAPGARVELRGCGVANDQGTMISTLAHLWNVRVQASTNDKLMGGIYWDQVMEARPGIGGIFHVHHIPVESKENR